MKVPGQLIFWMSLSSLVLSGCGLLGGDTTFDAGPILFISDKSGINQLYSMNENGENVKQLTHDPNFPIYEAKWSPDGQKIAVISLVEHNQTYPDFHRAIFVMNADGSGRYQLTPQWASVEDSALGTVNYGGAWYIVWSPDSKQITYSKLMVPEALGIYDVFLINTDGTQEKRIINSSSLTYRVTDWSNQEDLFWGLVVDYAEDSLGRRIRYDRLLTLNYQGAILNKWGNPGESWGWAVSAQNGNKIAFRYIDKNDNRDVHRMNSDGSEQINLTNGMCQSPSPIAWSPNDSRILLNCYQESNRGHRIFLLNADGTNIENITPFEGSYLRAASWRR